MLCYAGLKIEPREIERVAEEVGRQVEQWLSKQQEQILQRSAQSAPAAAPRPSSISASTAPVFRCAKANWWDGGANKPDGSARTREAKLGCVFTQVGLDKEGYPQRDPDSTTYVGAIESSTLFGWRMYAEALRRGLEQAKTVIVLTDGAAL